MEFDLSNLTPSDNAPIWCHYPFRSLQTDGIYGTPCCTFKPIRPIPIENYFNNNEILDVRQKILNRVIPDQCINCVESEKMIGSSFRTNANNFTFNNNSQEYSIQGDNNLTHLYLTGSNVCNLKCLPCYNSSFVRSLELYNLKLLKHPPTSRDSNFSQLLKQHVEKITIATGEPFYNKQVLEFLKEYPLHTNSTLVELDINTNLTNITTELLDFLVKNYKKVQIKGSVDGIGSTNDYLRYPSRFDEIEASIDLVLSYPEIEFCLTTALSNLALLHFYDLVAWGIDKGVRNHYTTNVLEIQELAVYRLPVALKQSLLNKFVDLKNNIDCQYHDRTAETLDTCINICNNNDDYDVSNLIEYLKKHDNLRGTDFLTVFSELKNFI